MFVFSLTGCSALHGSRGIRILGSAPDGRNRGYRDGLGKSPRSPCHLFRHVLRARLLRDLFRPSGSTSQPVGEKVDRRFSVPPHPFFRGFLNFFGAQLHHFTPNTIVYLAAFVLMCENFLGCRPHWAFSNTSSPADPSRSKRPSRVTRRPK